MRAFSGTSCAPFSPMARFTAMSSAKIASASARLSLARRMRSSAQNRFTAVGRLCASTA